VTRPARPEQKATAMTRNSGRQQLGAEGGGGGWQPRPKIRVAGKEENISGSLCGGRACNFGGKLKEAHFSLLPCLGWALEAFWSSKADFQSLVFICASDFLSHEAASKHKQTLP
jgi:hypothetical protein